MDNLNTKINEIKLKIIEKSSLQKKLDRYLKEESKLILKKEEMLAKLNKENKDVEKLESITLTNFIFSLKGDKDVKLEKEKREAIKAKYDYDSVCYSLNQVKKDIINLKANLNDFKDLDTQYSKYIKLKEIAIKEQGLVASKDLDEITEKINQNKNKIKEIDEAITAGKSLYTDIEEVKKSMNPAKGWGTFDILGGGLISTMAKHSHLDSAKKQLDQMQYSSRRFYKELKDVGVNTKININIGSFLTFADYFFDGLYADLTVQSRINDALVNIDLAISTLNNTLKNLENDKQSIKEMNSKLEKERIKIIEDIDT